MILNGGGEVLSTWGNQLLMKCMCFCDAPSFLIEAYYARAWNSKSGGLTSTWGDRVSAIQTSAFICRYLASCCGLVAFSCSFHSSSSALFIMPSWSTLSDHRWVLTSAPCQSMAMFPAKGTFILEICPSFYSVDGTIRELRAHVEEVVEYDSFQAVIRVKLEQLHCSTLVLVPMDFLSFSDRQQLLRLCRGFLQVSFTSCLIWCF